MRWLYDFSYLTRSIHEILSEMFQPATVTLIEMILAGISFMILFAILGLILVYAERKVSAFFNNG
jgi:NADH-quinone oxidoreductase subunit H